MSQIDLVQLARADLSIGEPIAFPIFHQQSTLLLSSGQQIETAQQLDALLEIGAYRIANWRSYQHDNRTLHLSEETALCAHVMSNLQLSPGITMHVRQQDGCHHSLTAIKLIGWLDDESIVLAGTERNGTHYAPPVGTLLECKLIAGKGVVIFESSVLANAVTPYPHLHLTYPKTVQIRQLRKHLRVMVTVPALASCADTSKQHDVAMVNLSTNGGMLEAANLFAQVDDEIRLQLSLLVAGQVHELTLCALVRNVHTYDNAGPAVCYGLEFTDLQHTEQLLLEHYVFQAMQDS